MIVTAKEWLCSRREVFTAAAVTAGALTGTGWLFTRRWTLGYDPQLVNCLHCRLLLIDHWNKVPEERGEIFAYRARQSAPVYPVGTLMAKHVSAFPGDTVTVDERERVLVNGRVIAMGLPHLRRMDPRIQRQFFGTKTLGPDEYWMMGDAFMSFDSRYWGAIRRDQLVGRAYVVV